MKKLFFEVMAVLLAICMLAGCTQATVTPSENPTEEPTQTPAYEGYLPQDSEEYKLFGGMQLWNSGFGLSSTYSEAYRYGENIKTEMTEELNTQEEYPYVRVAAPAGSHSNLFAGFNMTALNVNAEDYRVLKMEYRTNSDQSVFAPYAVTRKDTFPCKEGEEVSLNGNEEWQEVILDLEALLAEGVCALYEENYETLCIRFDVFGTGKVELTQPQYFDIRYVGFFPTVEQAESFDIIQQEEYLKKYTGADVVYEPVTDEILDKYMSAADQKKEEIVNSPNMDLSKVTGRCFYISNNGDDSNDGLSPETPWKTLQKLSDSYTLLGINYTDIILFERGSVWREPIPVLSNMRYSAYGEGEKPRFYCSVDGTGAENWEETETENVWKYKYPIEKDIGNIVFNNGDCWGIKLILDAATGQTKEAGMVTNGADVFRCKSREYTGPESILNNLEYFHDVNGTQEVYLRCEWGNPGEYFESLEMSKNQEHIIIEGNFMTFDNLCFMYSGSHSISTFNPTGLTVQNCVFEWIGGSLQGNEGTTRYGNAFQNWGSCMDVTIKDCYINQIYDAGITTQYSHPEKTAVVDGFYVTDNVIDRANYSLEFFMQSAEGTCYKRLQISGNYMRWAGYGFSHQRPDAKNGTFFMGFQGYHCDAPYYDSFFENNVGIYATHYLYLSQNMKENMPVFQNNIYICNSQRSCFMRSFVDFSATNGGVYLFPYQERYMKAFAQTGAESGSKFYYFTEDLFAEEAKGVYYNFNLNGNYDVFLVHK